MSYYDPLSDSWSYLGDVMPYTGNMKSMAPVQDKLWMLRNETVYVFDPASETWDIKGSYSGGDDINQTIADYSGYVYGHAQNGTIIRFSVEGETISQYTTGLGEQYETRMVFDPTVNAIFFGAYNTPEIHRFELNSLSMSPAVLSSIPEPQLNPIFCGDHSGHIYAAGGYFGNTMWQYEIATDSWTSLPDLPQDHGNNGSCTVSEEGYLYVGTGSLLRLFRLPLGKN